MVGDGEELNSYMKSFIYVMAVFFIGIFAVVLLANNVSADAHYLAASGNANAGATWTSGIAPVAGDDLYLAGAWNLALNEAITYGNIQLNATYSGTATQGAVDFGYSGLSMAGGTWNTAWNKIQTCSGNISQIGGVLDLPNWNLVMTGVGKTFVCTTWNNFLSFSVTGSVTINNGLPFYNIHVTGTLNIGTGFTLEVARYAGKMATLTGTFNGPGTLKLNYHDESKIDAFGVVNCPLVIYKWNSAGDRVLTLGSSLVSLSSITLYSGNAVATMTLNLAGYSLSATTITASTRGIISSSVAGAKIVTTGVITVSANGQLDATNIAYINCGGNFDSSAGTWVPGLCQVNMTTVYKSVKLGVAQTFYDLQLVNNINVTGQSSVTHLIKYVGLGVGSHYHWKNATAIADFTANVSGVVDISARILYVANLYRMEVFVHPLMITFPDTEVIIGYSYSYSYAADQVVTWVVTSSAPWLTVAGNPIGGIVDVLDIGGYSVNITGSNINGTVYQNYTVVVSAVVAVDLSIVYYMIFLISMTVLCLVGYLKRIPILSLLTMIITMLTLVASMSAFDGFEMIAFAFVLITVVLSALGLMRGR
jgi:hypothetical protein